MDEPLKRAVKILIQEVKPDKIILFGSRAKGFSDSHSDYDICMIKKGVKHRRKLAGEIYRLLYGVGAPVDVIVEIPERFEELKSNPYMIYHEIAAHGRILYDKSIIS